MLISDWLSKVTYNFHIPKQMRIIAYFLNSCTKYKWDHNSFQVNTGSEQDVYFMQKFSLIVIPENQNKTNCKAYIAIIMKYCYSYKQGASFPNSKA